MNELTDRRREEKDRRRNEILAAAAVVAAEYGFDATTMDQVAKQARLSRALLYVYFEDKIALQTGLCEQALELLQERFALATKDARNGGLEPRGNLALNAPDVCGILNQIRHRAHQMLPTFATSQVQQRR